MKANELRIGNLFKSEGKILTVKGIAPDDCRSNTIVWYDNELGFWLTANECEPIPLNEEVLLKCGFVKAPSDDDENRDTLSIQVANSTNLYYDPHNNHMRNDEPVEWYLSHYWNNNHFKNDFWSSPEYLHQLQNLFMSLTGNELDVSKI